MLSTTEEIVPLADLLVERTYEPRPLLSGIHNIGIIWSAKSACTKVISWFFKIHGLLPAVEFYHSWPHKYREEVLYNSRTYLQWVTSVDPDKIVWYQFIRDPVKRALSAYRHNLRYGYADRSISSILRREVNCDDGYSLNEFLEYLEKVNVYGPCDIHVKSQIHHLSDRATIFNLDDIDMFYCINSIEDDIGIPPTISKNSPIFASIDLSHNAKSVVVESFDPDFSYNKSHASLSWPVVKDLLPADTLHRIESIYRKDIDSLIKRRY